MADILNNPITDFVKANPLASGIGAGAVLGAGGLAIAGFGRRKSKKRKSRKSKASGRRGRIKHKTSKRGKTKYHKTSHRGSKAVHYTKNGQPYIILRNGRARFIKNSSAKRIKKLKGGRY